MKKTILCAVAAMLVGSAYAEETQVTIDPLCIREIGGVTTFKRSQYITIHEALRSRGMTNEDLRYMEDELEAEYGRDGGVLHSSAKAVKADPNNKDMPDLKSLKKLGQRFYKKRIDGKFSPENARNLIFCGNPMKLHPLPDKKGMQWGPRTKEGVAEFMAGFFKHYWKDGGRPEYLEVLNEPFVHAREIGTTPEDMSELHNVVAKRVRELNPDVKVGGYTAAWVEVEANNFGHWNNWQKKFMDIAGANMDFFSYHIYDGVNVKGTPRNRTGSNSEAIMDLIDSYSFIKFGVAKPLIISEYGLIPEGNMGQMTYSSKRSANMVKSLNGQLMTFMDHPDRLVRTIPFILGKALWTYGMKGKDEPGKANPFLLWRRLADGETFVITELELFYKFWKGIKGEWRKSISSNPDVRVHLLADERQLNFVIMNIDDNAQIINIDVPKKLPISRVEMRILSTHTDIPTVKSKRIRRIPKKLKLAPGQAVIIMANTYKTIKPKSKIEETRCYATEYMKDIDADEPLKFTFNDVPTGTGTATLRVSAGRKSDKQALPSSVKINGQELTIPTNWAGDDQAGRKMFFGAIEVDVPMALIKDTNNVEVTYPDTGGKLACVVLQVNKDAKL